ncbi:F-box family protein [Melia azedarach]|uniref:F-box family protein n=1 Tax=Melia azedarach TaxID=155640 RepID=A0ACC1WYF2_MELAZ|nr:F-box family protein [Melia azedarach]
MIWWSVLQSSMSIRQYHKAKGNGMLEQNHRGADTKLTEIGAALGIEVVASNKPMDSGLDIIVAFDLGTEKFHALPMLDYANKDDFGHGQIHLDLANLEGCLCVFCDYGFPYADVWMMKEYGVKESWTKLFSVQQSRKVSGLSFSRPLVYSKNGDKFLLELNGEKLGWFNLAKKTFRSVRIRGLRQDSFDAEICVGSLVLLNDGGGRGIRGMKHREQEEKREKNNKKRTSDVVVDLWQFSW